MKYIFFGTPEFAAIILDKLMAAGLPPAAVVTNPDRPAGRKKILTASPVKLTAISRRLAAGNILQPEKFDEVFAEKIKSYAADIFIVAAYGKILPKWLIEAPAKGTIGVHPSLLPKYRGPSPIQSAILAGEKITGATLFLLDEQIDHGIVLADSQILISNSETYQTLMEKLAEASGNLLIRIIPDFLSGRIIPRPQAESQATYTKKFKTEDGYVDLDKDDPETIWRKVRALNPEPGVYTIKDGQRLKILEADLISGKLILKKTQLAGKLPREVGKI